MFRHWLLVLSIVSLTFVNMNADAAPERKLAGIQLGMKPAEVIKQYGEPTAMIVAQPPLTQGALSEKALLGGGGPSSTPGEHTPNSLVFVYNNKEIELDSSENKENKGLPVWAHNVRVTKLSLDQQEFIYRINPYCSLGVVITGQRAEARVSDIIVCSFEPFIHYATPSQKQITASWKTLSAGTSKGVLLGSKFSEVLFKHKWTPYILPFSTANVAQIKLTPKSDKQDTPVLPAATDAVTQDVTATLTDGRDLNINSGFVRNCLMLYPAERVVMTLIDFTIVRIQIGEGVTPPVSPTPQQAN